MEEELLKRKKHNKIVPILCIIFGLILLCGGGYYYYTNYYNKSNEVKEEKVKPKLQDDFYDSVNYSNKKSAFVDGLQFAILNEMNIIQNIKNDSGFNDEAYTIFDSMFAEYEERDKRGIDDLKPYFEEIDNAKTLDEFSNIVVKVDYDLDVMSFLDFTIMPDLYDNSKNVIMFQPIDIENVVNYTLDELTPSGLEYSTNEKYSTFKNAFEKGRIEYFKLYGYDEKKATDLSKKITEFAKKIQLKSQPIDELQTNYIDYYKRVSKSELKNIIKNLPVDKLLNKYNLGNYQYFAILDEGHYKELDNYYKEENLPLMKEILKLLILEEVATFYTNSDYAKIGASIASDIVGMHIDRDVYIYEYNMLIITPALIEKYLNSKYDEINFTKEEKLEIIELINKIKDYYIEVIKQTDWLDEKTKTEAIKKLQQLTINVGYTPRKDGESPAKLVSKEDGGTLISNYILLNQNTANNIFKTINVASQPEIKQFLVNAYYNPSDNSINFPAAFKEVYKGITDKYEKYAYIGTIIGHEISHAFDNNGSKYDEKGNIKNWWSEDDTKDFTERKQKIVEYYSKFDVYGIKVDGEKTVGENIADLASIKTIVGIMENENATNEDFKKFFEGYARLWYDSLTKQELESLMIIDNHSPNKIRVNAVLSSTDKFYEVYDIKEGDKMYIPKEERVSLW